MGLAESYIIDLVLTGLVYLVIVWFMTKWMNGSPYKRPPGTGGDDGGLGVETSGPVLDLPPGVTSPGGEGYISPELPEVEVYDKTY